MTKPKKTVNFLCTAKLLEDFDEAWKKLGFHDRTEALHSVMRKFIEGR